MTLVVTATLPPASSAAIVILLSPLCSWIDGTDHVDWRTVPLSLAVPLPPRSLAQRTRYSHRLSLALPLRPTRPLELTLPTLAIATAGATLS